MDLALFDEEHGYYSQHVRTIGAGGDFATATTLSQILPQAVACSIRRHGHRQVIEVGPGAGHLAKALHRELRPPFSAPWKNVRYHIVERSPKLQARLRKMLDRAVRFHPSLGAALRATRGEAYILSNELVDAFPVRVFQQTHGWHELFLTPGEEGLTESWIASDELPDSTLFRHQWPEGQRIEVHESYHQWLATWIPLWKTGTCLTIDYGGTAQDIYHRHPGGTLRGYYHHERTTGPELYSLPGRRDLTADVNFDDLLHWGQALGLKQQRVITQAEFLKPVLDSNCPAAAEQFLSDPQGAGSAFKVLIQDR
ncbi:MAG: SAM-dependent methyltransferase [Roseibacillus sp.]|nr:SAM-dependent methyltransferase [Roseibacillus sp.]